MTVATVTSPVTTEQMLAMPENGVERWLIQGQLRESPMTVRNRWHSRIMTLVAHVLQSWLEKQPEPRGAVLTGEAGVRLRRNPDSTVGVDVVYVDAELAAQEPDDTNLIDGVPVLVVEILSPSDTQENIDEKIDDYLAAGVRLVWVIDPHDKTVLIYRPGAEPQLVTIAQELTADAELPSFRVQAGQLFS